MKFNVSKTALYNALSVVSKVIPSKSTLPILEKVLFDIQGSCLMLVGTDGETTIKTTIDVNNEGDENCKVALSHKMIMESLKDLSEQPIEFVVEGTAVTFKTACDKNKYSMVGEDGEVFPDIAYDTNYDGEIEMPNNSFVSVLSSAIGFAAEDELRPVLCGVCFDGQVDGLRIVATNAQQLYYKRMTEMVSEKAYKFILPKNAVDKIKGMVKGDGKVNIKYCGRNATLEFGSVAANNVVVTCRLIEGVYPMYERVIPINSKQVFVKTSDLLNALKRVSIFSNTDTSLVKMSVENDKITLSGQDIDYSTSAKEVLNCTYEGENVEIGFKAKSLISLLGNIESEEVEIRLEDPTRAALFYPVVQGNEDNNNLMLQMPMLLN